MKRILIAAALAATTLALVGIVELFRR